MILKSEVKHGLRYIRLKYGRINMDGDFFAIVDPSDWKQLKKEEEEEEEEEEE